LVDTCWYVAIPRWGKGKKMLTRIVIALSLTVTNTLAFSRCDKFSQASNLAGSALSGGGLAGNVVTGMLSRLFARG
jgi:hypothetical protein